MTSDEAVRIVNGPGARPGDLVIAGPDLKRGIRQAMAREAVPSIAELARRSHIRKDTFYIWFKKPIVHVSVGSVDKLTSALGAKPGDPWFQEPVVRTLDAESLAALDAAVDRAMDRLGDRLVELLDQRLPRTAPPDEP